jgi:hypothetical protein
MLHKNGKYIFTKSFFIILIITENHGILQLNQDLFVSRIAYRVSSGEKTNEKRR